MSRSKTKAFKISSKLSLQQLISSFSSTSSFASFSINKANQNKKAIMSSIKIRSFRELKDEKKDFIEYMKNLKWKYEQHYQLNDSMKNNKNRVMKVLFRQNLNDDAYQWYAEQKTKIKQNWTKLKAIFLKQYEIIVRDIQAKKFELRMKMTQLKQDNNKTIAKYLKRAENLTRLMINKNDQIKINMIMFRDMKNQFKKEQVNFDCNKKSNYFYFNVKRLIKAAYNQIDKSNFFEANIIVEIMMFQRHYVTNDELLRQTLININ